MLGGGIISVILGLYYNETLLQALEYKVQQLATLDQDIMTLQAFNSLLNTTTQVSVCLYNLTNQVDFLSGASLPVLHKIEYDLVKERILSNASIRDGEFLFDYTDVYKPNNSTTEQRLQDDLIVQIPHLTDSLAFFL